MIMGDMIIDDYDMLWIMKSAAGLLSLLFFAVVEQCNITDISVVRVIA